MRHETELMQQILQSPSAQRMVDYISPIYGEDYLALWLFEIMGRALDGVEEIGDSLWDQTVPQTATWTLPYWEEEYGATPDPSWTVEQRQANVLARIQYTAPVNPAKLAALVSAAAGVPSEIVENVSKNTFHVILHDASVTLGRARRVLDETKPAHLIVRFITQIEVTFPNPQDRFLLRRMSFAYRLRSYGGMFILLDGKRRLDGTWKLGQAASGARLICTAYRTILSEADAFHIGDLGFVSVIQMPQKLRQPSTGFRGSFRMSENLSTPAVHVKTSFQTKENFRGTLTRGQTWSFDGTYRWDGTKKFNAGIIKEEL